MGAKQKRQLARMRNEMTRVKKWRDLAHKDAQHAQASRLAAEKLSREFFPISTERRYEIGQHVVACTVHIDERSIAMIRGDTATNLAYVIGQMFADKLRPSKP